MGGAAAIALAQSGVAAAEGAAVVDVQEVVVTAQKRTQALQDVPASISAIPEQALQDRQLQTVEDFATTVPGLTFSQINGTSLIAIRGVAPDSSTPAVDPSVAQHVDGVYQPRPTSMNLVLADLESVEVLRGPQGTLYGRNATAGVINYNLHKPTRTPEYGGSVLLGNYDAVRVKGYLSGPITSTLSSRIAFIEEHHSGFGENLFTGQSVEDLDLTGVRAALRWEPSEAVTVDLAAHRVESRSNGPTTYAFSPASGPDIVTYAPLSMLVTPEPRKVYSHARTFQKNDQSAVTAIVSAEVAQGLTLRSVSGYIDQRYQDLRDSVPNAVPLATVSADFASEFYSQEFNAIYEHGPISAVAGLYYMSEDFDQSTVVAFLLPSAATRNMRATNITTAPLETRTKAVFGDVAFSVTDRLKLLGGLRYTKDEKDIVQSVALVPISVSCTNAKFSKSWTSTTGRFGVQYDLTPHIMVYGQWQNGFRAGGYNIAACGDDFNPEKIESLETGMKARFFDGVLTLNISAYDAKVRDLQVVQRVLINGVNAQRIENAARARNKGLEVESWLRLSSNLRLEASAALLDAKYHDYASVNPLTGVLVNLDGFQVMRAPKYTVNVAAEYDVRPTENVEVTFRGEIFRSDKIWYTPFHEAIAAQNSPFTIVNAYATIKPDGSPWRFAIFGKNIFDEAYRTSGQTSAAYRNGRGTWNEPRTYGVEVSGAF